MTRFHDGSSPVTGQISALVPLIIESLTYTKATESLEPTLLINEGRVVSDRGLDLSPALISLMKWGDRWFADSKPPTVLVHDRCGTPLALRVLCPECDEPVVHEHIRSRKR